MGRIPVKFSELFNRYLARGGHTPAELARALEVSRSAVSKWENGTNIPKIEKLVELSNIFKLNTNEEKEFFEAAGRKKYIKLTHLDSQLSLTKQDSARDKSSTPRIVPLQRPPRVPYFIGREKEIKEIINKLLPGCVVTVWGMTGIGKTTIAAEVIERMIQANELLKRFPDGVIFYSFYDREEQADAKHALEHILLSLREDPGAIPSATARRTLDNRQALLILDGTEWAHDLKQLIDVIQSGSKCGVLITTQRREDIEDELIEIGSLSFNETKVLFQFFGGENATNESAIKEVYELVGGHTLAIAGIGFYLREQKEDIEDYLGWLKTKRIDALDFNIRRQASIPLWLERSLSHLSNGAKLVLAVMGALAFEPVNRDLLVEALAVQEHDIRKKLQELVNYGFLIPVEKRYQIHHKLIHEYVSERLPVPEEAIERLANYYTELAEEQFSLGVNGYSRVEIETRHIRRVMDVLANRESWGKVHNLALILFKGFDIKEQWCIASHMLDKIVVWEKGKKAAEVLGLKKKRFWDCKTASYFHFYGIGDEALRAYRGALEDAWPKSKDNEIGLKINIFGAVSNTRNRYKQIVDRYQQTLAILRNSGNRKIEAKILSHLGGIREDLGQEEKALECYEQVLEILDNIGDWKDELEYLGDIGIYYIKLGKIDQAIECFKRALTLTVKMESNKATDRIYSEAFWSVILGDIYFNLNEHKKSIDHYQQFLDFTRFENVRFVDPESVSVSDHIHKCSLCRARTITENIGSDDFRKCYGYMLKVELLIKVGHIYEEKLGQVEKAINYYEQVLAISREFGDPRCAEIILPCFGHAYVGLHQYETAIEYLKQARASLHESGFKDREAKILHQIGHLYENLYQYQWAIEYLELARSIHHEIGEHQSEGEDLKCIGRMFACLHQYDKSAPVLQKAIELSPNNFTIYNNLARVYLSLGQLDNSIYYFQRRIELHPEDALSAHVCLGIIALRQENEIEAQYQFDTALNVWDNALQNQVQSPFDLLENKALVYLGLGQVEEALDTLKNALDQRRPHDIIDFTCYDLLAEAPSSPQGLAELRRLLEEAMKKDLE